MTDEGAQLYLALRAMDNIYVMMIEKSASQYNADEMRQMNEAHRKCRDALFGSTSGSVVVDGNIHLSATGRPRNYTYDR